MSRSLPVTHVFDRILVGVDGSEGGLEAAVQAARLAHDDGWVELAMAVYLVDAHLQHWPPARVAETLASETSAPLAAARTRVGREVATRALDGLPERALPAEAARVGATLIALGGPGSGRLLSVVYSGIAGPVVQEADCSVLVARRSADASTFPRSIVVGVDGSPGSLVALACARDLADRFGASLRSVLARPAHVDVERARAADPLLEIVAAPSAHALIHAAAGTDLLVVGNRGLRGARAVGSVSDRVARHAPCSVLVVREPAADG